MRNTLTLAILVVCLKTGGELLIRKPQDSVTATGKSAYFTCSTSERSKPILWYHYATNRAHRESIYQYANFTEYWYPCYRNGRYVVERDQASGAYNLVISTVLLSDAGRYLCEVEGDEGMATLTVKVESNPTCVASKICKPYIKSYSGAIICTVLIMLSIAISGTILVMRCVLVYRPKKRKQKGPFTNDEIKHRVLNVYAKFVTDVDPDRLSDWLVQEHVISIEEMLRIRNANHTAPDRCRAFLSHLLTIQHPRTFLVVREVLRERNHHLLEYIDIQKPVFRPQPETARHEDTMKLQQLEEYEGQKKVWEADRLLNMKKLESKLKLEETEQLMSATIDHTAKIQELKNELERGRSDVRSLADQLQEQSDTNRELQEKGKASEIKISQLVAKMQDVERSLYRKGNIDYAEKLTLAHTITTDASKQRQEPINSMTFLGKKIFVSHEYNSVIETYDSETFQFRSRWTIDGMSHPLDLASCKIANCLYIIFRKGRGSESYIMRRNPKGQLIKEWPSGGDHGRLSTYESNVIVCLSEKQLIKEFNGDGELLHTVSLLPAVGFKHPWHAIKVTSSQFAVCHGAVIDELHRVCIVDVQGNVVKELREWESKQKDGKLNVPISLAEDSERSILVADRGNKKIRLLNCHLKFQRNLIIQEMGLDGHPVRIFLDEIKGRLFVAANTIRSNKKEWKDGRILIFNIR